MESLSLIFIFSLLITSFKPSLSSTLGVDAISRTLQIQHRERSPPSVQEAAARSVLLRLLPSHSDSFHFRIISKAFQFPLSISLT
jgi:alpha-N-acetylglucosaminidase